VIILDKYTVETSEYEGYVKVSFHEESMAKCPVCGKYTLRIENGCYSCTNNDCGYSKCDM